MYCYQLKLLNNFYICIKAYNRGRVVSSKKEFANAQEFVGTRVTVTL